MVQQASGIHPIRRSPACLTPDTTFRVPPPSLPHSPYFAEALHPIIQIPADVPRRLDLHGRRGHLSFARKRTHPPCNRGRDRVVLRVSKLPQSAPGGPF